jgi:hypothetical protein
MRTGIVICLFLLATPIATAQLRFVERTVDLGELRGGVVYQHRFEFINDSPNPTEITGIRLGCGCLAPVYDKRMYRPGERGSLLMYIRTLGQPDGTRSWNAHIQYRVADKQNEATLVIGAKIRNEIRITPSILAITVEGTLKQEVIVSDERAVPLNISSVLATSPAIRAGVMPGKDGVIKIALEINGSALTASHQEEMLNIYTDDPFYRHLQVPITLTKAARPSASATPPRIEILGAGSQLVRLRGTGDQVVRVDKMEANHPALKCTWASGPGNDATLKIATLMAIDADTQVRVHIGASVIVIPVKASQE